MRLETEFIKLPLRFDVARLQGEIATFSESDWRPHPQGFPGNSALLLVSVEGDPTNDELRGPMQPTPLLQASPYLQQVIAAFGGVVGRTRLMRLGPEAQATAHVDLNYYWHQRARIHVPIQTHPDVTFVCGDARLHMAAGESWLFDTWRQHNVLNPTTTTRIHLVVDTVGSEAFWSLVNRGTRPHAGEPDGATTTVAFAPQAEVTLRCERVNFPRVMSPYELEQLLAALAHDLAHHEADLVASWLAPLRSLVAEWRGVWAQQGSAGELDPYLQLKQAMALAATRLPATAQLSNGANASQYVQQAVVTALVDSQAAADIAEATPAAPAPTRKPGNNRSGRPVQAPVFVVSAPRAGSTWVFETLARSPDIATIGGESHGVFEAIPALRPEQRDWHSNRLLASDADMPTIKAIRGLFFRQLRDHQGQPWQPNGRPVRLLEKTPKNALRIPFIREVYPDARFIYLYRQPQAAIASMIEAWQSGRFVTYPDLPGWSGPPWSLLLISDREALLGQDLATITAQQWRVANEAIMAALANVAEDDWTAVSYESLLADPVDGFAHLAAFAGVEWQPTWGENQQLSAHTVSAPDPQKWQRHAAVIQPQLARVEDTVARAETMIKAAQSRDVVAPVLTPLAAAEPTATPGPEATDTAAQQVPAQPAPITHTHTVGFKNLLDKAGCSLAVSTFETNQLVLLRSGAEQVEAVAVELLKPMGLASRRQVLAVGCAQDIVQFVNARSTAPQIPPVGRYDSFFLPQHMQATGNIDIHEMAFVGGELWFVNTRFSCLATLSDGYFSFKPQWRPEFISGYSPEDRCHLNGLGVRDGEVRYVSGLGVSDEPNGWRQLAAGNGFLIDIKANRTITDSLCMPHSPRWHRDQLWLLESGEGALITVDPTSGRKTVIAKLPGFTRGLDFIGPFAIVGVSRLRDRSAFPDLPIYDRQPEPQCGVWVVDTRDGSIKAHLAFDEGASELFAVAVLQGSRCPHIVDAENPLNANHFLLPEPALAEVQAPRATAIEVDS